MTWKWAVKVGLLLLAGPTENDHSIAVVTARLIVIAPRPMGAAEADPAGRGPDWPTEECIRYESPK